MSHPLDIAALRASAPELERRFAGFKDKQLALDMTRGKPCSEQLDLATGCSRTSARRLQGCRWDGLPQLRRVDGLPEAKNLFSEFPGCRPRARS
jgi:hypothetical protein